MIKRTTVIGIWTWKKVKTSFLWTRDESNTKTICLLSHRSTIGNCLLFSSLIHPLSAKLSKRVYYMLFFFFVFGFWWLRPTHLFSFWKERIDFVAIIFPCIKTNYGFGIFAILFSINVRFLFPWNLHRLKNHWQHLNWYRLIKIELPWSECVCVYVVILLIYQKGIPT